MKFSPFCIPVRLFYFTALEGSFGHVLPEGQVIVPSFRAF